MESTQAKRAPLGPPSAPTMSSGRRNLPRASNDAFPIGSFCGAPCARPSIEGRHPAKSSHQPPHGRALAVQRTSRPRAFAECDGLWHLHARNQGIAICPANATNRFAALPAVTATQAELGLHAKLSPKLAFIASVFQVAKPTAGFDALGAYRLVNKERHQGVESLLRARSPTDFPRSLGPPFSLPDWTASWLTPASKLIAR